MQIGALIFKCYTSIIYLCISLITYKLCTKNVILVKRLTTHKLIIYFVNAS